MANILQPNYLIGLIALNPISPARVTDNAALGIVRAGEQMPGVDAVGVEHLARLLPTAADSMKLVLTMLAQSIRDIAKTKQNTILFRRISLRVPKYP